MLRTTSHCVLEDGKNKIKTTRPFEKRKISPCMNKNKISWIAEAIKKGHMRAKFTENIFAQIKGEIFMNKNPKPKNF